jgi:UDP:flavonoid glycosyltransferase YjiC (YdhE family)
MKLGFVSMPLSGHLNPMTALARRLQSRGNEIVFFGVPDVEPFARAAGLAFVPYGEVEYPVGSIDKLYRSVTTMRGFEVVRHSCMDLNLDITRVAFDYLAEKLATTGVEALVIAGAEQAVILRLKQLENSADHHHELTALIDALSALEILRETIWAE